MYLEPRSKRVMFLVCIFHSSVYYPALYFLVPYFYIAWFPRNVNGDLRGLKTELSTHEEEWITTSNVHFRSWKGMHCYTYLIYFSLIIINFNIVFLHICYTLYILLAMLNLPIIWFMNTMFISLISILSINGGITDDVFNIRLYYLHFHYFNCLFFCAYLSFRI